MIGTRPRPCRFYPWHRQELRGVQNGGRRLALLYVAVSIGAATLLAFFLTYSHRQAYVAGETTGRNIATGVAARVEASLNRINATLEEISATVPREALSEATVAKFHRQIDESLRLRAKDFPDLLTYRIFDDDGRLLYRADAMPAPDIANLPFFRYLKQHPGTPLYFSETIIARSAQRPVMVVAKPLLDASGRFRGVIAAPIDLDVYVKLFASLNVGKDGIISIRRADDSRLVARWPEVEEEINQPATETPVYKLIQAGQIDGVTLYTGHVDKVDRIFAFHRVGQYPFYILAGKALGEQFAAWRRVAYVSVSALIVLLLLLGHFIRRIWLGQTKEAAAAKHYHSVVSALSEGVITVDRDGAIKTWNPAAERILGLTGNELEGLKDFASNCQTIHEDGTPFPPGTRPGSEVLLTGVAQSNVIMGINKPDSAPTWLLVSAVPILEPRNPSPSAVVISFTDITERKTAEEKLRLAASVFDSSYDGVIITDANNVVIDCNPAFTRITGYAREDIIGQTPRLLASGRQGSEFYARMWESVKEQDSWQGEIWNRRKTGEVYAEMLAISVVRDAAGQLQHYIGVFTDISQIKAHEAELHHIAHYDTLTGVPNRRLLADRLDQAISHVRRSGKSLAVCYLDLDGFKPINDRYGHAVGDELLVAITSRLKEVLRAEDTLARLGGDEFILIFTDLAQPEEIHIALDRVIATMSSPILVKDAPISISASIGVTLYPGDDADPDTLVRHADHAMYRAKEAGKNRYQLFDPERDRQVQSHRSQLQRLREALAAGEFVLYYQPKVNLVTGDVIGAEALIRWQHPELGLLAPGQFLPYLNGTDLEIALGEWVIDSAVRQIAAWSDAGLALTVSANVNADHLLQGNFTERLRLTLERHPKATPGHLELEILETAALTDMDQAIQVLTRCRHLGVRFALDDFGTGYSSLTYFRSLPVDILKIDQSFVRDMLEDPDDLSIVESVVRLAHAFNRPVIAEGVETLEHGALLVHLGCHLAQGYGIARPMPAVQFPDWVEQWRSKASWLTIDGRLTSREDLILSVAAQSHRNWISKIVEYLEDPKDEVLISLDSHHCRFGRWYQGSGTARYGEFQEFQAIAPLHERVHSLAAEAVALARNGQTEAARTCLAALHETRDELLKLLDAMIEKAASSGMQELEHNRHIDRATPGKGKT